MKVKICYYGLIGEITEKSSEQLDVKYTSLSELIIRLEKEYKELTHEIYKIAVNDSIVNGDILLTENMKIDLLPPFAGG